MKVGSNGVEKRYLRKSIGLLRCCGAVGKARTPVCNHGCVCVVEGAARVKATSKTMRMVLMTIIASDNLWWSQPNSLTLEQVASFDMIWIVMKMTLIGQVHGSSPSLLSKTLMRPVLN